jgi:RimJ/RimL family protein N-acetyltransferase
MIRQAVPGDEAALDAFLAGHAATSMFLRGNLARLGLGPSDSPHATTYHLYPALGPVEAVIGRTAFGMVLCQLGTAPQALAPLIRGLDGQMITGVTGEAGQTGALIALLGLGQTLRRNAVEPLFHLNLADMPATADQTRPPGLQDEDLLAGWFQQYLTDTGLAASPLDATKEARERAVSAIAGGTVRLLIREGRPVAMAALNAEAAGMVQVGGVFVPADLRNRGLGGAVTQAVLADARARGAKEAVLFANNPAAARAYRAIGFAEVGSYRIAFLHAPITVGIKA